ncbi:RluA family pseudouridine synthase [Paenibacillus caui]|uniref:RluA family pseudouridine synthase n=1 Tax=Paenibacillus caui TaxID=2873927 RepID=UPI001CA829B9|nr:RluA family pseudouridine synthase [Paenibacillus caui]
MSQYYNPIVYTVAAAEDGWLLKTVLQRRLGVSRKLMSRLKLTEQGITLNGERVYISVTVKEGDQVAIRLEQEISEDILPQPIPFDILYEDDALLIINKQPGIIVHPTHGHYTETLANGVVYYWQQRGERFRFRPVHRLDQETSGVLAVAKNAYVHQHISEQMLADQVLKKYSAFVHGTPPIEERRIDDPIDRDPLEPHRRIVTESGYPALTFYRVKESYKHGSWVELQLGTGRTHQIRVHMSHLGNPLIGDKMYGFSMLQSLAEEKRQAAAKLDASMKRQALHAEKLGFKHPLTGEQIVFTAPLPEDMHRLRQLLIQGQP